MKHSLLIASLAAIAMVSSCSPANEKSSAKSAYSEYDIVNEKQIQWADVLSQQEKEYIVFFYSETCSHCHEMMDEIISFASDNIEPTYFMDVGKNTIVIKPANEIEIGVEDIKDFAIQGTPTIVEVVEGRVTANVGGLDPCLTFMSEKRMEKD